MYEWNYRVCAGNGRRNFWKGARLCRRPATAALQKWGNGIILWRSDIPTLCDCSCPHTAALLNYFKYFSNGGFSRSLIAGCSMFSGVTNTTPVSIRFSTFSPCKCFTMDITDR